MSDHVPSNYYSIEMSALKFLMGEAEALMEPVRQTLGRDVSKALRTGDAPLSQSLCQDLSVKLQPGLVQSQTLVNLDFTCSLIFKQPLLSLLPFKFSKPSASLSSKRPTHNSVSNRLPVCQTEDSNLLIYNLITTSKLYCGLSVE